MKFMRVKRAMTLFVFATLLAVGTNVSFSSKAEAQVGWYTGPNWGWGIFPPTIWNQVFVPYGYSYYPYYDYQPYYATFAAISYSAENDSFGLAWGEPTRSDALSDAKAYCAKEDCKPAIWVQGGCAAIATGPKGTVMGGAYASDRITAQTYAHQACLRESHGTVKCKLRAWICSF